MAKCQVYRNGKIVSIIALIDYGANIYTLLNQRKVRALTKVLNLLVYPL